MYIAWFMGTWNAWAEFLINKTFLYLEAKPVNPFMVDIILQESLNVFNVTVI